ncbi:hypothetical protein [Enterobacter cloacae]|uniref:hypothetical protein n=1 Tax=Enterobacter cloacae TaxID=550 RepID=UPI002E7BAEF2|nr:hypothetical protein [Enterobacter cloacae]
MRKPKLQIHTTAGDPIANNQKCLVSMYRPNIRMRITLMTSIAAKTANQQDIFGVAGRG